MTKLRYLVEAAVFRLLMLVARIVPRGLLLSVGSGLGALVGRINRRHTRIALDNLRLAFGEEIEEARARSVVDRCWRHFGRNTVDLLCFPRFGPDAVGKEVHYEGLEHLEAACARGNGVIVFSGHYGHWELIALMQGFIGMPMSMVTRPLDNPYLEGMLAGLRDRSGNQIIHKKQALNAMLRVLREKRNLAIVIDQDARSAGVFVDFFERPASTTPALALLALRTGAAVIPTYSQPDGQGGWRVVYEPEVRITSTGDKKEDIRRITQDCTTIIERWVRQRPELWLWMHRRWKTPPPGPGGAE